MTTAENFIQEVKNFGNAAWIIIKPLIPFIIPMFLIERVKSRERKRSPREQFNSFVVGTCTSIGFSELILHFINLDSEIVKTAINCFIYAWAESFWYYIINIKISKEVTELIKGSIKSIGDWIKNKLK